MRVKVRRPKCLHSLSEIKRGNACAARGNSNAEEEGITFKFLVAPTRFIGDEQGKVKGMEYVRWSLANPMQTGKRNVVPVKGSEAVMDVDTVIVAIGRTPNPIIQGTTKGLETLSGGIIAIDRKTRKNQLGSGLRWRRHSNRRSHSYKRHGFRQNSGKKHTQLP